MGHTGGVAKDLDQPLYGRLTLITGPEAYLAERQITRLVAQGRAEMPQAAVIAADGPELTGSLVDQMGGTDLFSPATIACLRQAEKTPKNCEAALIGLAEAVPGNVALIVTHAGGNQGKALLSKLTGLAGAVIDCPEIKPYHLAQFVTAEVRTAGRMIDSEAAQSLVDSVGQDTRSLVAAVAQLLADSDSATISAGIVAQYFAGRVTVTSYAVADDALAGRVGEAIMKLRWALSTGVAHVQVTSALASSLRQMGNYLDAARTHRPSPADIGVPPWKLKDVAASANAWSERTLAAAIRAVSQADAQIKGAAQDPDFALERLIIRLASLRRAARD